MINLRSIITFFCIFASSITLAQIKILDRIVAIVDDDVVLQSELNQRMISIMDQISQSTTSVPPEDIIKQQVLERLISERIQLTMGYNAGVRISDDELNQAIGRVALSNNLSTDQYIDQLSSQGSDLSIVREEIKQELIIMRVQQASVMRRIRISEQELNNFLNSEEGKLVSSPDVKIGQILLAISGNSTKSDVEKISEQAMDLYNLIRDGKDFKELAISYSMDQSALQGGDLGWRNMAQLPKIFSEKIELLELNEVSEPIRSGAGLHLIKLYEKRGGEEKLIEQNLVRHILVEPNELRDEKATIKFLQDIKKQIVSNEIFYELAKEHSEDKSSALDGGNLGWSTPGMFVPEFEAVMNNISVGMISEPFQSQFGWHILQVTERRQQDFSQEILRNRAQNLIRQRKYEEELQVWLQEIKDEAFIEIKI
jgi:peptidyl-prolyl cis-trans isomerase SurA